VTRQRPWWLIVAREGGFIAVAALFYSLVRGLTDDRVDAAFDNAERVIAFERWLGIYVEPDIQDVALRSSQLIDLANAIYIAYWPIVFGTLLWLLLRHRAMFPLFRNALLASGAMTLVVFALFPLAPPRFLPEHGFVDTIAAGSEGYRSFNASALVNEYAAMPSLHFGWVLLVGIALFTLAQHPAVRAAGLIFPILMMASIVVTGNHFIVDGLVGGAIVVAGLGIAHGLRWHFGPDSRREIW
jgi:membrane-associated phospholipid phosphatase